MNRYLCGMMISGLAAVALTSCGDNSNACGMGTHAEGGYCLPDATCGPGTVDDGTGTCVPDGSVICGDGTVFDPATGDCVPDDSVCGAGTVLVDGHCIDEGIVDPDAEEAPEPNDGDGPAEIAGEIAVPAIGGAGFVIHGCVNPYRDVVNNGDGTLGSDGNLDSDLDFWVLQVTAPTALHIVADGVQGLAAGFLMLTGDDQLFNDGWQRFGVNLVNDKSERDVFLPKAGVYVLAMADSRALFLDAAGGPDACYYTTITQIALPAATPGTITDTDGVDTGALRVLSFDPGAGDNVFDQLFDDGGSSALAGGIVAMKNGTYLSSAVEQPGLFGVSPPALVAGALADTDTLTVVVDALYNYSITPQPYTLVTSHITAQALPTDGSDATITPVSGAASSNADLNWLYFDVAAGGLITHWDMDFNGDDAALLVMDSAGHILAEVSNPFFGDPLVTGFEDAGGNRDQFIKFPAAGRYYVAVFRPGALPTDTWTLTNTLTPMASPAIAVGTPEDNVSLPATHSAFYTFDPATSTWLNITGGATAGGANVFARIYDLAGYGWLDGVYTGRYPALGQYQFPSAGGTYYEHIFIGDPNNYLIRVLVTTPHANTTFDLDIENQDHVDLGTITAGTPIDRTGDSFVANDSQRYLATTAAANEVSITATPNTATPNLDLMIDALDPNLTVIGHADSGFDGDPETLGTGLNPFGFIAVRVNDYNDSAGTIDLHVTAAAPRPYTIAPGTLAFTDACAGGTEILTAADDSVSAVQTLPANFSAFEFFGGAASDFVVSSNGFLSFDTSSGSAFSNTTIPTATAPNGFLAPYWDDLITTVCVDEDATANTVTVQWTGQTYTGATAVAFQAVLHSNGVVDFVYDAAQAANGASATVGAETRIGTFGHQISYNTAGSVSPSTSQTLTPQ